MNIIIDRGFQIDRETLVVLATVMLALVTGRGGCFH
ncbi:MAG: hypothetical protein QOK46_768 [Microbacteriaceae bacterium]|nr:hypothetical protein [Microbacteriaceae bacterium]